MAAAAAFVAVLVFLVLGFLSFALLVVTFLFGFLFSFIILCSDDVRVPFFSPFVLALQLLWVVVDVEEVKVAVLVMSEFVCLRLDPGSTLQLIVVQELVAENVIGRSVAHNKLPSGLTSICEWMWTWCVLVGVKQLENDLLTLSVGTFLGLGTDKDRFLIISDVDEGLGWNIPEEEAVLSSLISLDPEPARLELKFGVFIEDSGVTEIRGSSLSLLCDVESLVRLQEIILYGLIKLNEIIIVELQRCRRRLLR